MNNKREFRCSVTHWDTADLIHKPEKTQQSSEAKEALARMLERQSKGLNNETK